MGLTIHYSLESTTKSAKRAGRLVEQMRQLALDLPFEEVGEIVSLEGKECDFEHKRGKVDELRHWLLIQASQHVSCPWNERLSRSVMPSKIIAFDTIPGPGSETANFGLCQYPSHVDWDYLPQYDVRFDEEYQPGGPGSKSWRFSWRKWDRWLRRHGHASYLMPDDDRFAEVRKVKTGLNGWQWSSFCKTQYASNPQCGGIPNFLRCHISVITLLDRIAKLPTVKVETGDEGRYGPSKYSDDWKEARVEGREPTYVWHAGKYDPKALAAEVGDWNGMIAAFAGALKDTASDSGLTCESAIAEFPTFEQLEFQGSQDERIEPFLQAMKSLALRPQTDN
jgi:hypothetical protein